MYKCIFFCMPVFLFSLCENLTVPIEAPRHPCNPSPCGANAVCKERNGAGSCTCLSEYTGDPYAGCRPECVMNSDCPRTRACINNKCKDPCPGTCGINAECSVNNHAPSCSCLLGYTGNPLRACHLIPIERKIYFISHCCFLHFLFSFLISSCYGATKNKSLQTVPVRSIQCL